VNLWTKPLGSCMIAVTRDPHILWVVVIYHLIFFIALHDYAA
jgi:hypothetical protein